MKESKLLQPLLDASNGNQTVYARQFIYTHLNVQKCTYRFILATEAEIWELYIQKGQRTILEIIPEKKPCHLYIDIDVDLEKTPGIKAHDCWDAIKPIIVDNFNVLYPDDTVTFIVMDSSSNKKGSLHIIVNIEGRLFLNASHCGAYMRVLKEFIAQKHPSLQGHYAFFDLGIYTRNRLFRMLGQTKAGQKRYLTGDRPCTFETWRAARVCPVEIPSDIFLIETKEIDQSEPSYTSGCKVSSTVTVGWVPPCFTCGPRSIQNHLMEKWGAFPRVVFFPEGLKVVCTTDNHNCIFQQRAHGSNVLYLVVDLLHNCYTVKCFSAKCKGKRSKVHFLNKEHEEVINDWLNREVGSEEKCIKRKRC